MAMLPSSKMLSMMRGASDEGAGQLPPTNIVWNQSVVYSAGSI